ncbi:MAG: D-amino acid aminotransferase, partial [Rhodobacteraceae bacterium]|nr:D-amino acid aminotransferase [Paracoccaceae bacterium]
MSRIVYVNGEYVSEESAVISVFDRGFLMADAVYEVTSVLDGKLLEFDGHLKRLKRSLSELDMQEPDAINDLLEIHRTLVRDNQVDQGGV